MSNLTTNEIKALLAIIERGSKAGLFRGADLSTVGAVHDELNALGAEAQSGGAV